MVKLCTQSNNDWFRVYLIRKICTQHGLEFVQGLLKVEDLRWVFPEEVIQQVLLSDLRPRSVFFLSVVFSQAALIQSDPSHFVRP